MRSTRLCLRRVFLIRCNYGDYDDEFLHLMSVIKYRLSFLKLWDHVRRTILRLPSLSLCTCALVRLLALIYLSSPPVLLFYTRTTTQTDLQR
jgi:hypothetical protein